MELPIKQKKTRRLPTMTGFLSFLIALVTLAFLNVALITEAEDQPLDFIFQLPFFGVFLGIIGLFTRKYSRLFAVWGIALNTFLLVFYLLMFISAMMINVKP
ncbi:MULTISPECIES: hypothetical protein [Bacillus]|uniref:hypothetical protein n=1 Tax=Bacillus TaxID=1386 RepID=UPI0002D4A913|nr:MULTISPECIES: hypothetical protein [Bacillus]